MFSAVVSAERSRSIADLPGTEGRNLEPFSYSPLGVFSVSVVKLAFNSGVLLAFSRLFESQQFRGLLALP